MAIPVSSLPVSEPARTRAAASRVDAEIGLYIHLAIYVMVIALLVAVDYVDGEGWWVMWPAAGWGIGIIGHALGVLSRTSETVARWRLRRIRDVRQRL